MALPGNARDHGRAQGGLALDARDGVGAKHLRQGLRRERESGLGHGRWTSSHRRERGREAGGPKVERRGCRPVCLFRAEVETRLLFSLVSTFAPLPACPPPPTPPRVRLCAISARALNMSHVAVSLALRDSPRVSTARRAEVRAMAEKLGYRPDPMLASLVAYRQGKRSAGIRACLAWINQWKNPEELRAYKEFEQYWQGAAEAAERPWLSPGGVSLAPRQIRQAPANHPANARRARPAHPAPRRRHGHARLRLEPVLARALRRLGHDPARPHRDERPGPLFAPRLRKSPRARPSAHRLRQRHAFRAQHPRALPRGLPERARGARAAQPAAGHADLRDGAAPSPRRVARLVAKKQTRRARHHPARPALARLGPRPARARGRGSGGDPACSTATSTPARIKIPTRSAAWR